MKTFLSAEDIEAVASRGQTQLILDTDTILTDVARRTAETLGVTLVDSKSGAGRAPAGSAAVRPSAVGSFGGRPKGCQSRPNSGNAVPASGSAAGPSNQVIDRLVQVIKSRD